MVKTMRNLVLACEVLVVSIFAMHAQPASAQSTDSYASTTPPAASAPASTQPYQWHDAKRPPAADAGSSYDDSNVPNYKWGETKDYLVSTHGGFDPITHVLRPDRLVVARQEVALVARLRQPRRDDGDHHRRQDPRCDHAPRMGGDEAAEAREHEGRR